MKPVVPLLALLVGCVGKHGGDSPAADSTGDSAIDAPSCELSHPWVMNTVGDVGLAAGLAYPDVARLTMLDVIAMTDAQTFSSTGEPCPTYTESDDGTSVTVSGDCTVWGTQYGGTATFTEVDGSYSSVYDHFLFDDRENNPMSYDVDGMWLDEDGQFTFDLTATLLGDWGAASDATVTYVTTMTWVDPAERVEGYADIVNQPASAATGDLCVVADWQSVDSCDSEDDAVFTLQGSAPATLTWSGSASCDGCADVTIDEADAGSYCPGPM